MLVAPQPSRIPRASLSAHPSVSGAGSSFCVSALAGLSLSRADSFVWPDLIDLHWDVPSRMTKPQSGEC